MADELLIYFLIGILGIMVGYVGVFRGYAEKVKDILIDLKMRGKINDEEYEYFLRTYVSRKDKTKIIKTVLGTIRKKKVDKEEI